MSNQKLKIQSRIDWLRFLDAISKINNSAIVSVSDNGTLTSLVASPDQNLILYGEINNVYSTINATLNIPDINKLKRVVDNINTESIEFTLNNNSIEYKGSGVKFKYHLFDDGYLSKPSINVNKVMELKCDVNFKFTKQVLTSIIKGSSFATDTSKVYLFTDGTDLRAELTDRSKHNTDMYSLTLGTVDFELDPVILNLDNVRLLHCIDDVIHFGINTNVGVNIVDICNSSTKLKYIITTLTQ